MDLTVVRSRDRSEPDKSCVVLIFWFISSNKNKNERAVRVLRWSNEVEAVRRSIFKSKIRNYKEQNNDEAYFLLRTARQIIKISYLVDGISECILKMTSQTTADCLDTIT